MSRFLRLLPLVACWAVPALAQHEVTIADVALFEGDMGVTQAVFEVTLTTLPDVLSHAGPVVVDYQTANGTATDGDGDYVPVSGSLTFTSDGMMMIQVGVVGDLKVEADETFLVQLSSTDPTVMFLDDEGEATVNNDDSTELSIDDVAVAEGDAGPAAASFTVSLSAPSDFSVTVDVATADGSAVAGSDYQALSTKITLPPGTTSHPVSVTVNGDLTVEADETFLVNLSNPSGATLADPQGTGTITNDDGTALSIGDVTVTEGDSGTVSAVFPVSLTTPSDLGVTVGFETRDGSATAASGDYSPTAGTLAFGPGETAKTVSVAVAGDIAVEPDETFSVVLLAPDGATLADDTGLGTILNDDQQPGELRLVSVPATVESAGRALATVERTGGSDGPAGVTLSTVAGTATAGADYRGVARRLSWADGEEGQRTVEIELLDDALLEGDETVSVVLGSPAGAALGSPSQLELRILDDDRPARIEAVGDTELAARVDSELVLTVRVSRDDGAPVAGATVEWEIVGQGALTGEPATTTDGDGLSSQRVRLAAAPGPATATAALAGSGASVEFRITVEGDLDELFDPATAPGEASLASALNDACFDPTPELAPACDYLFSLDPDDQRRVIVALTPSQTGALPDLGLRAPWVQLFNLREHLAAVRRGGGGGTEQLSVHLQGDPLPLEALARVAFGRLPQAPAGDAARGLADRIDAALAAAAGAQEPSQTPPATPAPAADVDQPTRWSFFASGRLEMGDRPGTSLERGYDLDTLGITAGVDYRLRPGTVAGAALGFVDTETTVAGGGAVEVSGHSASAFVTWFGDHLWADGIVSWSTVDYEARRVIVLPVPLAGSSRLTARSSPGGEQVAVDVGLGWDTSRGASSFTGFGRLSYLEARVDGFTEQGGGPFNLTFRRQQVESLLAEAGVEIVWALSRSWGVLQPLVRASALHELEDDPREVLAVLAAAPGSATVRVPTDAPDRDFLRVGLGVTATLARGRGVYVLYETDLERDDLDLSRLTAGLRIEF